MMQYLFSGEWVEVPVYAPYDNCRRIAIEYTIPVRRLEVRDLRIIEPSWRKLTAFLLAEGATSTIRKVRSKRAASKLTGDYHVVFAVGSDIDAVAEAPGEPTRTTYLCLGTRHPTCADVMLFARDLTAPISDVPSSRILAGVVSGVCSPADEALDAIGGYNVFSGLPVPADALNLLHSVKASLNTAREDFTEREADPFHVMKPPKRHHNGPKKARENGDILRRSGSRRGAAVIAAGDYVRTDVIPALNRAGFALKAVADIEPHIAKYTKQRFGFEAAETDWRRALDAPGVDTVVIATFHDTHAMIAADALRREKRVLLEKPPVVTRDDLSLLLEAARAGGFLDIGYNRRYAPHARAARRLLSEAEGPTTITMLVREVEIPPQHWYRWPKQGTRVTGNLCHWIDLATFLLGMGPVPKEMSVSAPADVEPDEERTFAIVYHDGTTVTIVATQRGDPTLGVQELIDIRRGDLSIRIDDFRRLDATKLGRQMRRSYSRRDKGHRAMYDDMLQRIKSGQPPSYTISELEVTSLLTILATEMVRSGASYLSVTDHYPT